MRGTGTGEHNYAGNQQVLVGEHFCMWRAWDGIRALDYLMSRKEVDLRHLGITGNSGGGTMTTWLCGVEQRWTMAAPSCFVTEFRRNMENELGADAGAVPAEGAGPGPRSRRLPGRARAETHHHPGQGERLLRRARQRSGLPSVEASLSSARRGRQSRLLRGTDLPRLFPGEPRSHVPLVQPLHGSFGRQDRTEAGHGGRKDAVVHAARAGGRTAIQADLHLHAGEVARAGGETARSGRRGAGQNRRRSASAAAADRRAGIPHFEASARPEVSDAARAALHGGNRPGCARDRLQAHQGAAALASAARHQQGHPVRLARIRRRGAPRRAAHPGSHRRRTGGRVLCVRRARRRRFGAADDQPERPWRIQHGLFLLVARDHAGLSLCRPADLRRAARARLAERVGLRTESTWPRAATARCPRRSPRCSPRT